MYGERLEQVTIEEVSSTCEHTCSSLTISLPRSSRDIRYNSKQNFIFCETGLKCYTFISESNGDDLNVDGLLTSPNHVIS